MAFHELGHALAASNEGMSISSIGFIIQIIFPIAYVKLSETNVLKSPWSQLKIYCAGVWHNIFLFAIVYFLLFYLYFWSWPLFKVPDSGLMISKVKFQSSQFTKGMRLEQINKFKINNYKDFTNFIQQTIDTNFSSHQICIQKNIFDLNINTNCCSENYFGQEACWESKDEKIKNCIPVNKILSNQIDCDHRLNSSQIFIQHFVSQKDKKLHRMLLFITIDNNLIVIIQNPLFIYHQLEFFQIEPRSWMPLFSFEMMNYFLKFLNFLLNLNLITPIISILPVVYFDGQKVLEIFSFIILPRLSQNKRQLILKIISNFITLISIMSISLAYYRLF